MDRKYLVCLVCCEEFKKGCGGGGGDLRRKEENVQSLKQFCEVVLEDDRNELDDGKKKDDKDKLSKLMENLDDNLSICGKCMDLIGTVTEARISAKRVEEGVEKLQLLLLRELRRLQGRLDMFWRELEKMEKALVNGDLKFIEDKLFGGKKLSRNLGKKSADVLKRKKEILGFRGKISKVFSDFHQFHSRLADKIACSPVSRVSRTAASADKQPHHHKVLSSPSPPALAPTSGELGRKEDGDVGDMDDEPMHLDNDNFDDNGNLGEDNQMETMPADKRESLRRRGEKKKYEKPSDSEEEDNPQNSGADDDSEEYNPEEVSKSRKQVGRPSKGKKQDRRKSSNLDQDEQEKKWSGSEDDDEEYKPEEPVGRPLRTKISNLFREYEPHLSRMSPFKRNLIKSVLKRQCLNENQQEKKGQDKLNVFQRHMTYLSYNVETQLINLKDIPIKILCQSEEEDRGNGLLCMKCDFNVAECPKMENLMYEHVLSQHLSAYQCPHCRVDKQFESYSQYSNHIYKCLRRREKVEQVECDICGKSLCNSSALQQHKWSHMSELEKAEALESGVVKKAPLNSYVKGMEKRFQCEQCGKSFAVKTGLQQHEKTHWERESREQFICPKCGKSFLKAGYEYHLKYDEVCGKEDPNRQKETCLKCGRILKNKMLLKRHMRWVHAEGELRDLKPFVCKICGKGFGRKGSWKKHENTHSGEKPWRCGKCGAGFVTKFSLRRHEATCAK